MSWLIELIDALAKGGPLSLSIGFNVIQAMALIALYKDCQKRYSEQVGRYVEFLDRNTDTLGAVLEKVMRDDAEIEKEKDAIRERGRTHKDPY